MGHMPLLVSVLRLQKLAPRFTHKFIESYIPTFDSFLKCGSPRLMLSKFQKEPMKRYLFILGLLGCAAVIIQAQTHAPYKPFTAEQARLGKELAAKSQEIRKGITNLSAPAEPFKIIGN